MFCAYVMKKLVERPKMFPTVKLQIFVQYLLSNIRRETDLYKSINTRAQKSTTEAEA